VGDVVDLDDHSIGSRGRGQEPLSRHDATDTEPDEQRANKHEPNEDEAHKTWPMRPSS
jgi:hypothetical protein